MKIPKAIIVFIISLFLVSCTRTTNNISDTSVHNNNQNIAEDDYQIYTDDLKRDVKLPKHITRVAVSGRIAQSIIYAIAPDMLVGVAEPWSESEKTIIKSEYQSLPIVGRVYGISNKVNLEVLISLSPDVVIDCGENKDSSKKDMDNFTSRTGIPFIHITLDDNNLDDVYKKLGELLNRKEKSQTIITYINKVFSYMHETFKATEKKDAIFLTGKNAERILANGSYFSSALDMCSNNIAKFSKLDGMSYAPHYTPEQLLLFHPDVVIFSALVDENILISNSIVNSVDAVSNGSFYFFPHIPYENMGFPPGPSEIFGILWLLNTLYPNNITFSYDNEIKEFYKLFYDVII